MKPVKLENWLRRRPRPSALKLRMSQGEKDMPTVNVRSWADIAESVETLDPEVIEALDEQGATLRVIRADQIIRSDDDDHEPEPPPVYAHPDTIRVQPPTTLGSMEDPMCRLLTVFAGHLSHAYQFSTNIAFTKMVDLFAAVNERGESREKTLDRLNALLVRQAEVIADQANEDVEGEQPPGVVPDVDPIALMMQAYAQSQIMKAQAKAQQEAAATAGAKTNGTGPGPHKAAGKKTTNGAAAPPKNGTES